jgi:DNA-directed DNA polymerase III PolC
MISEIKKFYLEDRLGSIDKDFLSFEEDMISEKDSEIILSLMNSPTQIALPNPYNSIILFLTGLTSDFDFIKARADTVGGSPPDIDIDFDAIERHKAIDWVIEYWGRENVANIITHGTFKPKSLTKAYYRVTEGDSQEMNNILKVIPPPKYGKEATLEEIVAIEPEIKKYTDYYSAATKLENMISNFGIHAAGIVISDFPISDIVPVWKNSKAEAITQFDKDEVESLGLIKFDFLSIDTLSIMKETVRLIKQERNIDLNIEEIEDGDNKTYKMMHVGMLTGVFQMETSGSAKQLIGDIEPMSIEEISDISALNRPGPLQANFHKIYIENKRNGYAPDELPAPVAKILEETNWTLVYQEQVMKLCSELAGFTLQEADDVRRAMGKKKASVLAKWQPRFINGCVNNANLTKDYAEELWIILAGDPEDETNNGFADYCFNKSHSVCYSRLTYISAYLKANYPIEFFCALMTVRSQTLQPKLWAQKAPEYIQEAKSLGVEINAPSVNSSNLNFSIQSNQIYFGLNAIRDVGVTAAKCIMSARGQAPYKDIIDFINRTNLRKVTTKTFMALIKAGAFDRMGYLRSELEEQAILLYDNVKKIALAQERELDIISRDRENAQKDARKQEVAQELKEAKALVRSLKKQKKDIPQTLLHVIERNDRIKTYRAIASQVTSSNGQLSDALDSIQLAEYEEALWLRKLPKLKPIEVPDMPEFIRGSKVELTLTDIMQQAYYIGCYVNSHPVKLMNTDSDPMSSLEVGQKGKVCGVVNSIKVIKTRRGQKMCFIELDDSTNIAEIVVFPKLFNNLNVRDAVPQPADLLVLDVKVEQTDPKVKLIAERITIYEE